MLLVFRAAVLLGAGFVCAALYADASNAANAEARDEFSVKAAIVYNFSKFVHRQDDVNEGRICVLGSDDSVSAFDKLLGGSADKLSIEYSRLENKDSGFSSCRLLFIARSENAKLAEIMALAASEKVLTLSDLPEFINRGGMVSLDTVRGKVRFSINLNRVNESGLAIDSQLLRLARIVE